MHIYAKIRSMEIKRDKYLNKLIDSANYKLIKVITGIRRSGKSYLLNVLYKNYLLNQKGVKPDHIICFSFDNDDEVDKLESYFPEEPTKITENVESFYVVNSKKFRAYIKDQIKDSGKYYLLLDEIQLLENFVGTLNSYLNNENLDVYVTGSNSKFLSSDVITEFRGREYEIYLQPLSFREFCSAKPNVDFHSSYKEYTMYGGLPLVLQYNKDEDKVNFLKKLNKELYIKDLIERNRIDKVDEFNQLFSFISSNIGNLFNPTKIENTFKSVEKINYSANTITKHLGYLSNAFLISECKRYDIKGRKYIGANSKYYFNDLGTRNAILNFRQLDDTHLMENVIYNELIYRDYNVDVGVVEKSVVEKGKLIRKYYEADFVCNKGSERIYIQSVYSMPDMEKYKQESLSLINTRDSFKKVIIVGEDTYKHQTDDGIIIMSLSDFLIGTEL